MRIPTVLVGCGAISAKHIDAIAACADSFELVGVFDVDADRAQSAADAARSAGAGEGCLAFTDTDEMAAATKPQVAAIATPSALHADQAIYWMNRGAHLVLEKPVALSSADLNRIQAVQQESGRAVAVGYVLRHAPHVRIVEKAVRSGRLGRILHASLSIYWNRNNEYYSAAPWRGTWVNDGGSLMNQATHGIDLLQALVPGQPESVHGRLARFLRPIEADDFAAATIRFDSGAIATLQCTVDTYPKNLGSRLTLLGETGTVELSGNSPTTISEWRFPEDPEWAEIDDAIAAGETSASMSGPAGHAGIYADLADAIAAGREPLTGLAQSSVSAAIVLAILSSHHSRTEVRYPVDFSTSDMKPEDL